MARTYQYEPIVLSDVMKSIISEVSTNLSTDIDLGIPQVTFKYGSWTDIQNELIADTSDPAKKNIKYPLVCLLGDYTTNEEGLSNIELLIVDLTTKNKKMDDRIIDVYKPVINPIYAELIEVMSVSPYFTFVGDKIPHQAVNLPHMGSTTEQKGYILPDVLDGKLLTNMSVKIANDMCEGSCDGHVEAIIHDAITDVRVEGFATPIISILMVDAIAINPTGLASTYTLALPLFASMPIVKGTPIHYSVAALPDGIYAFTIQSSNGAEFLFYVEVRAGVANSGFKNYVCQDVAELTCIGDSYSYRVIHLITMRGHDINDYQISLNGPPVYSGAYPLPSLNQTLEYNVLNILYNEVNEIEVFNINRDYSIYNKIYLHYKKN
jgi:hypothetical protein